MYKILFILFVGNSLFAQAKSIKIISVEEIDYYYVYKVIDGSTIMNDTLIILSANNNSNDFKEIKLIPGQKYHVETRKLHSFRVAKDKVIFCSPGVEKINGITVANKGSLPVLILNAEAIICKERE